MKKQILLTALLCTYNISLAQNHDIYIVFKQYNIDKLENIVYDVSDISSLNYGNYLSKNEILDIISPQKSVLEPVNSWLTSYGISNDQIHDLGDSWKINLDYNTTQMLLGIQIFPIKNSRYVISHDTYTIPHELTDIVDFIGGVIYNVPSINKLPVHKNGFNVDPGYIGREVGCRLYSMNCNETLLNTSVGAIEYQNNQGFSSVDLRNSQQNNWQNYTNMTHIIGTNYGIDPESELDVQMISQTANGTDMWFWVADGWLYEFAVDFFNSDNVPDIISMSWGWAEDRQCTIANCGVNVTSQDYVRRVNNEYLKIAARGISVLVSSGDAGSPGRTSETCDHKRPVNPVFPSSSPWVTSVGATFIEVNDSVSSTNWVTPLCQQYKCATGTTEHVANFEYTQWTAGGGFSIYLDEIRPFWQENVVEQYLSSGVPLPTNFNRNGRAYPDVSAFGHNCPTWLNGQLTPIDGTSCSSPVFAGIVAMLNHHQISQKKPKLGYLNPLLYQMYSDDESTFNKVVGGNNWCTEFTCCPTKSDGGSDFGYKGIEGYDPVSGLGTPNVVNMKKWLDKNV